MLLPTVLSGFATGLGLIVAIGAQNAYLLRLSASASRRTTIAAVVLCAGSDMLLICAGVVGVGVVVEQVPVGIVVARVVGAGFLIVYGLLAARRVIRPTGGALRVEAPATAPAPHAGGGTAVLEAPTRTTARRALVAMAVFTWANPHVYLDTLIFLGAVANQHGPDLRWWWVLGAVAASWLWFSAVGLGGRLLAPVLARPRVWRVLDAAIAVVMIALGISLLLGS